MARRTLKVQHDDETRARIKASQLINRLQGHVDGKVKMDATQIQAARILLDKVLPNLSSTDINANVAHRDYVVSAKPMSEEAWAAEHEVDDAADQLH